MEAQAEVPETVLVRGPVPETVLGPVPEAVLVLVLVLGQVPGAVLVVELARAAEVAVSEPVEAAMESVQVLTAPAQREYLHPSRHSRPMHKKHLPVPALSPYGAMCAAPSTFQYSKHAPLPFNTGIGELHRRCSVACECEVGIQSRSALEEADAGLTIGPRRFVHLTNQ